MDRNQAKEFYPVLKAFAEGKVIECRTKPSELGKGLRDMNDWTEMKAIPLWSGIEYRIKPESKYRPFANGEECWKEMCKHKPFGWVIKKSNDREYNIQSVLIKENVLYIRSSYVELERAFNDYTFADGTPFGIKEEE